MEEKRRFISRTMTFGNLLTVAIILISLIGVGSTLYADVERSKNDIKHLQQQELKREELDRNYRREIKEDVKEVKDDVKKLNEKVDRFLNEIVQQRRREDRAR